MADRKVYFMQHGLAVDKADDPERPLSDAGIQQTHKIAETLRASGIMISSIYHSGKLRAAQTADIMAATLGLDSVTMIEGLSPNDETALLSHKLDNSDALYVGHLPHLEKLVSQLIAGRTDPPIIIFRNSALLCIENSNMMTQDNQQRFWRIKWYLTPESLGLA